MEPSNHSVALRHRGLHMDAGDGGGRGTPKKATQKSGKLARRQSQRQRTPAASCSSLNVETKLSGNWLGGTTDSLNS